MTTARAHTLEDSPSTSSALRIDSRFQGPDEAGNGGYSAGRLAALVDGPTAVRLRRPVPLERSLQVIRREEGAAELYDQEELIASTSPQSIDVTPPFIPTLEQARLAERDYLGQKAHIFPRCFVCGPARAPGDGLRIFPGPIPNTDIVGAIWTPAVELSTDGRNVDREYVWAALDCPGAWGLMLAEGPQPMVLGTLAVEATGPIQAGQSYAAIGFSLGRDGRKLYAGTGLVDSEGRVLATARATWIAL